MKTTIEMRLVDNGKWNKGLAHIAKEMEWNIHKEYDTAEEAKTALELFQKKKVFYEYRIKP